MFFSIIVPIYNVEKYLEACLDSLINQNFFDYEIFLIDDGSTDSCGTICDRFASGNHNIKCYHKKNGGLSDARNYGLDAANGEYIIFFDADDVMYEGTLEKIYTRLKLRPDVLITELYDTVDMVVQDPTMRLFTVPQGNPSYSSVIDFVFSKKKHTWSAPQYIVKKELVDNKSLRFWDGKYHEDVSWTFDLFLQAKSFAFYNEIWYVRRLSRPGSIMNVPKAKRTLDLLEIVNKQLENPFLELLLEKDKWVIANRLVESIFTSITYCKYYSKSEKFLIASNIEKNKNMYAKYIKRNSHKFFLRLVSLIGGEKSLNIIELLYYYKR